MLNIESLWVRYPRDSEPVLRGVNLRLESGLVIVAGKTGSGKTTLARVISGLIPHFISAEVDGIVNVLGVDPIANGIKALAGRLAYLSQNPEMAVLSSTVVDEIVFPLCNMGIPRDEMYRRLEWVSKMLNIDDLLEKNVLCISSGQLQLVAIASALATGARVLVLDEPLARADPLNVRVIVGVLRKVADDGRLVLVFEHHLDHIFWVADRIVVLEGGIVREYADPMYSLDVLHNVDMPELCRVFWTLYKSGCIDRVPRGITDAIRMIDDALDRKHMV